MAAKGREAFEREELIQTWIVHHLEIVGEAARAISDKTRALAPMIPWQEIVAMRNVLVHAYFGIDTAHVWMTVERDVPTLRRNIEALLSRL
ncbi:MAG: DUF86 domain-containing protein [Myxococcota bacterium]